MIPTISLLVDTGGTAAYRMQAQTIYGIRFAKPISPAFGLELNLGAGSGKLELVSSDVIELKTSVWFADLRGRLRIAGGDNAALGLLFGAGWTQYSSGLFDAAHEADDDTKFKGTATGIVGLGFKGKLGDRAIFSFDATDRIHEQGIDAPLLSGGGFAEKTQHDASFTFGLAFPLGS
jgi:hypothetical protein